MKTKQIIFTVTLLFLGLLINAQDKQDKYEFMIIEYVTPPLKQLNISIDGVQFIKEDVDYSKYEKTGYNANPLLAKVKEYQDKNWEVMSFQTAYQGSNTFEVYFAYLRKKKEDKK